MAGIRKHVLCAVGIDEYDEFQTLSCCTKDATAICEAFRRKVPQVGVKLLHSESSSPEPPQKSIIDQLLIEISSSNLREDDLVAFYYAGHGYSTGGRDYLVCADSKQKDESTAICTDDVISSLTASGAGTALLIVDACRLLIDRSAAYFGEQTAELARRQGVIVLFGCSPGEVSQELAKIGNGIFTHSLIRVIDSGGPLTPLDIDRFAQTHVAKICTANKLAPQRPYTTVGPIQKAVVDIFTGQEIYTKSPRGGRTILIVGSSNSGKTTLGQYLASKRGCAHIEMSSFAYKRFQTEQFNGSIQDFMENVVWDGGHKDQIAQDLIASQPNLDQVVICGPRTLEEIESLRAHYDGCISLYLFANAPLRYKRYAESGQLDRFSLGYGEFIERDLRELSWGLARAAGLSGMDIVLNEGSLEELYKAIGANVLT